MTFYRKRPVVIDANEWVGGPLEASYIIDWVLAHGGTMWYVDYDENGSPAPEHLEISTLEGTMTAQVGDFIIRGVQGEFYPCKPDIFHKTYERV